MNTADVLPPLLRRWLRPLRRDRIRWTGRYADWAAAAAACGDGYGDDAILARAVSATRAVLAGKAAYERDGELFAEPAARCGLLAALHQVALRCGSLRVIDWGGALASTWLQHRSWLRGVPGLDWRVVEQPALVAQGRLLFPDGLPSFHATPSAAGPADVVLFSGALQYLPDPEAALAQAAALAPAICLDRLLTSDGPAHRAVVQRLPASFSGRCYPCWLLSPERLARVLGQLGLVELLSWPGDERAADERLRFSGALWGPPAWR